MTKGRTDEEIIDALRLAGVPEAYRKQDITLDSCGAVGMRLALLIQGKKHHDLFSGGALEIEGTSVNHHKAFYLFVRAMVIRNLAAAVVYAEDLITSHMTEETEKTLADYSVIAVAGMTPHNCNPFGNSAASVEWRLSRWLDSGRGLILLTDGQIHNCEVWSNRFRALIEDRQIQY